MLRNPNVRQRVHNSLPLIPLLCQMNQMYVPLSYGFEIRFNTILPYTPVFTEVTFFHVSRPKASVHLSSSLYNPYSLSISSSLISTPEQQVGRRTNHEASHLAIFSSLQSLPPLRAKYCPQHFILEHSNVTN
jgi:hypothetical protein